MAFQFVQSRQFNHLTWCGVDSTDAFTREPALSNLWRIRIFGKVEGSSAVTTIKSGLGALTNSIKVLPPSAYGVYTIALVKADLSHATAAWFDEYTVTLSATGAAYETFVVEGTRTDTSHISAVLSDVMSRVEDVYSLLNSRVPDITTTSSDLASVMWNYIGGAGRTLTPSGLSQVGSAVWRQPWTVHSAAGSFGSAFERILSDTSNANSILVVGGGGGATASQVWNYIGGLGRTLGPSGISDIASAVWAQSWNTHSVAGSFGSAFERVASNASDAASAAQQANSRALVNQSTVSNIYELLSDVDSALTSQFTYTSNMLSNLSQVQSDTYSQTQRFENTFNSRFPATIPELAADPGATPTWARAQALEYMWLRNNSKTTTAKRYLRNDAGTTVLSAPHAETAGVSYVQGKLG